VPCSPLASTTSEHLSSISLYFAYYGTCVTLNHPDNTEPPTLHTLTLKHTFSHTTHTAHTRAPPNTGDIVEAVVNISGAETLMPGSAYYTLRLESSCIPVYIVLTQHALRLESSCIPVYIVLYTTRTTLLFHMFRA
jgi:hypothetical protein